MDAPQSMDNMGRTSIQVTDELADELWNRKNRGESYEDVIWRLINRADDDGTVEADLDRQQVQETPATSEDGNAGDDQADEEVTTGDAVNKVVDRVSDGWEDTDERLRTRREAARAVLQHAIETGDAVGKTDAIDQFLPEYAVDGQNNETWWRNNIRPVLSDVGDYSSGRHGYVVDDLNDE